MASGPALSAEQTTALASAHIQVCRGPARHDCFWSPWGLRRRCGFATVAIVV